jgi:hypothetical protein
MCSTVAEHEFEVQASSGGKYSDPVHVTRYRCTACGNLTRFDVTVTRRSRAFHHFTVGGALSVEDEEVLEENVEEVSCRWCGSDRSVEVLEEEPA